MRTVLWSNGWPPWGTRAPQADGEPVDEGVHALHNIAMSRHAPILIPVCALVLAGCVGMKYPMLTTLSPTDADAMTCSQLHDQGLVAEDTTQQIDLIAQGGRPRFSQRPVLYSTARPDAERAAQARLSVIEAALLAKGCSPDGNRSGAA
ncbi:hypothetical protein BREVUG8_100105 [Brevundimonas sp. G8]|nr:hypothetical protein BREVUG8_100105 [Brevundimonas sp. G8]